METRICSDCGKEKELNEENFKKCRTRIYIYFEKRCRMCNRGKERIYYNTKRKTDEKRKLYIKYYKTTDVYKAGQKRYRKGKNGKARCKEYNQSEKGKITSLKGLNIFKAKYPERYREFCRKTARKEIKELKDNYIKNLLVYGIPLSKGDITPELIELKRKQLKLRRLCKQQQLQM